MTSPALDHLINSVTTRIRDPDSNWGTSKFNIDTSLASSVVKLHFVAHEDEDDEGGDEDDGCMDPGSNPDGEDEEVTMPTNHWSLFLEMPNNKSIHVDAVPSLESDQPGVVVLENMSGSVTDRNTRQVSADVPSETTVAATILEVIINRNRDRYVFQPIGEGCRFWLSTLASDLVDAGVLDVDAMRQVKEDLCYYWPFPKGTPPAVRPMAEGIFV